MTLAPPALFELIPLLDAEQELPPPDRGPYVVATRTGYMIAQKTHWGVTLTEADKAPLLADKGNTLVYDIDFPADIIGQAWSFFAAVYEARKSEAMVDITWDKTHGYRLFVPPQQASGGGVKATRTPEHYHGDIVGTIHSHCMMDAFHSTTDHADADGQNGLHMTIGKVLNDKLQIAIMVSAGKAYWDLELKDITKEPVTRQPFPAWWLNQVKDPVITRYTAPTAKPGTKPATHYPTPAAGSGGAIIGFPRDDDAYTNIDALIYDRFDATDGRVPFLEEIAGWFDQAQTTLENMGYDLDIRITPWLSAAQAMRMDQWDTDYITSEKGSPS